MFTTFSRRGRRSLYVKQTLASVTAVFVLLIGMTISANAAVEQPKITLGFQQGVVTVQGVGYPKSAQVMVVGAVTGGSGQGSTTTTADGDFKIGIKAPNWQPSDTMQVTATSGTTTQTDSIVLQNLPVAAPSLPVPTTATPATPPAPVVKEPVEAAAQTRSGPTPNGPAGSWKLVFGDDFSTGTLDATKWSTCFHWGCKGANADIEAQTYTPSNVKLSGGKVALTATANGKTSGMLAAKQTTAFKYGYMEMRAQMPKCAGCWPAFWSIPDDLSWPPEIDVMEGLDSDSSIVSTNYHYKGTGEDAQSGAKRYNSPIDLAGGYHTYGADWQPNGITWYIDGKVVNSYTNTSVLPTVPMYVVANLAIDNSRGGAIAPEGAVMNIDYIRVFQKG